MYGNSPVLYVVNGLIFKNQEISYQCSIIKHVMFLYMPRDKLVDIRDTMLQYNLGNSLNPAIF